MIYDFQAGQNLEAINLKASEGWEVHSIFQTATPSNFDVFYSNGTPQYLEAISTTTGPLPATFYLDKTFSYGDIILSVFLTIGLIFGIVICLWRFIYPFNFKQH